MRQTLLLRCVLLLVLSVTTGKLKAQSIGIPVVVAPGGPVQISFSVTNGTDPSGYFQGDTQYIVYLSDPSGSNFQQVYTFNSSIFPPSVPSASAMVTRSIPLPAGTVPGSGYRIAISSTLPVSIGAVGANASAPFTLFSNFTSPATLSGFIKCSSPSITYYLMTITNTGNLTDTFNLSKSQTGAWLDSQFYSLTGTVITATPSIDPGESFTFMMRFDTPNGTPPDQWNYTDVAITSAISPNIVHHTMITTYIYCGNNHPNLPDAPDLEIVKTASTALATVGEFINYTVTIKNVSTKIANNPVIRDFIPANTELVSYSKAAGETRNVLFTYDAITRILTALVQSNITSASLPLTITIRVRTNCSSVPLVLNNAEVYTVSGDNNPQNDTSSATTSVSYDLTNSDVGRWTGAYNNDWFDCRNWSGGVVPNNNTDVIIPSATPNADINKLSVLAPADKIARSHDLSLVGTLSMSNAGLYHISGNWSSAGGFSAGDGSVTFMGSVNNSYQMISDTTDKVEFYDLTMNTSNNARGLSVPTNFGLIIHDNLSLAQGDIRLNGKSQLVQTKPGASTNPVAGNGKLYVDQQGKSNVFSYNYWSSPVGSNNTYTVNSVLRDGTNPSNPLNINWSGGYNGSPTSPITMASYWLFTFQDLTSSFANWQAVGPNGTLLAGQGFLMKGSGASTPLQNYTFTGKPHNGQFTSSVSATYMNLSGNPYPCALDAYAFIDDNIQSMTGTLYFWEQFTTNSSHITANYEGGYATLTKTGTTPPASPAGISSAGSSNRRPGRYIPVAQGFIIFGNSTGGVIRYSNTQRAFVRESDPTSNPMFRGNESASGQKKLRIGFSSADVSRQLLLGYMNGSATSGFDKGYDAMQIDTQPTDMYFTLGQDKLVIEAKGSFQVSDIVPVGIRMNQGGIITIGLQGEENFAENVWLYDAESAKYYDLKNGSAEIALAEGTFEGRFSLRFTATVSAKLLQAKREAFVAHGKLYIDNADGKIIIAELFNIAGQKISTWNTKTSEGNLIYPVHQFPAGAYIVKLQGNETLETKKVIIN